MKPYKSFQELTGRAAVLLQELSGLCWGSVDALYPQAGYETTSCSPAAGFAQRSSRSRPSKPCLVTTLAPGQTGLMPWLQRSFLLRHWTSGPEGSAWPGGRLATAWVVGTATFLLPTARVVLVGG